MKTLIRLSLFSGILWLSSCNKTLEEVWTEVTIGTPEIVLPENVAGGSQRTTTTFTTTSSWRIELSDTKTASDWVRVSPQSGEAGTVTLTIEADENRTPWERIAYLRLLTGNEEHRISLTQPGDGTLPAGESIYRTGAVQDTIVVKLPAGRSYRTSIEQGDSWLEAPVLASGERFDSLFFFLSTNRTLNERTAIVRINDPSGTYESLLTIIQPSPALDITLSLPHIQLPTGSAGSDAPAEWVDSLFVAGFDAEGNLLFTQNIPQADRAPFTFQVMPPEALVRNFYPSSRIYVVANSSNVLTDFDDDEQEFVNRKDTAISRLFDTDRFLPPLSGMTVRDLSFGANQVAVNLAHVTALVTFKIGFDTSWTGSQTIEQINIGGFSTWGYLFQPETELLVSPRATTFNPTVEPKADNRYLFFAYENSQLVLTVLAGGRYYQGKAPDILKRGYKYTFDMRLTEVSNHMPAASEREELSKAAPGAEQVEQTIWLSPVQ